MLISNDRGLWSYEDVRFCRHGTPLATVEIFVKQSVQGYDGDELAHELHAGVQQPLRHLATQHRLADIAMGSQSVYTAIDPISRRNQTAGRRSAHAVPLTVHASLQASPDQRKTAILLLYGLLDEQQQRLFARAGIHPPGNSQTLVRLLHNLGDSLRVNH